MTPPRTISAETKARIAELGIELSPTCAVEGFGDSAEMATELGLLVSKGVKTATAGLLWEYETDGDPLPAVGRQELIVDWDGMPLALIRVIEVTVVPFSEVGPDFAAAEGEGDKMLDWWREAHWAFFSKVCERIRRAPTDAMPIVCIRFELEHGFR